MEDILKKSVLIFQSDVSKCLIFFKKILFFAQLSF